MSSAKDNLDTRTHANNISMMGAYGALVLAMLHGVAGLSILVISSWFIAISAIAPVGFNYVIPAVVIRGLALLRIASGYTSMWLGHNDLLTRIAKSRLSVFAQLTAKRLDNKAWTIEALANHTEQVASAFIAWVSPLASVALLMLGLMVATYLLNVPGNEAILALIILWVGLSIYTVVNAVLAVRKTAQKELAFRNESANFLQSSSIWHLKKKTANGLMNAPGVTSMNHAQLREQKLVARSMWLFQGGVFALVVAILWLANSPVFFVPLAVITPMVLLASPDWANGAFTSLLKFAKWRNSRQALQTMQTTSLSLLGEHKPLTSISLVDFAPVGRGIAPVNLELPSKGLVILKGHSGSGKSSILQSLSGLEPYSGRREVDGYATAQGQINKWVYVEQQPIVLAGSVKLNLSPTGSGISEEAMKTCLERVGLTDLDKLTTWVGKGGRALSGGESKRLALARAVLSNPDVLLIDEPFEGLDGENQARVAALINQVSKDCLVVVATHVMPISLQPDKTLLLNEIARKKVLQELKVTTKKAP